MLQDFKRAKGSAEDANQSINRSPQKLHTQLREAYPSTATDVYQQDDRGRRLLQKMGWAPGAALGAKKGAETREATRPLADFLPMQNDRRGLGAGRR